MGREGKAGHLTALDSWRGICALIVASFHFPIDGFVRDIQVVAHGYLFVDFFFVLSGFVIGRNYEQRLLLPGEKGKYLIRRFGRIWPLHAAILAAFVAIATYRGVLGADESHSYEAIVSNLFLVHGTGVHDELTWNDPSWSISVEFMLYLLFAALAWSPYRTAIYIGLIAGSLLILIYWAPGGMTSTFDFGLYRGMAGFFAGVLIARAPAIRMGVAAELIAVGGVVAFVSADTMQFLAPAIFGGAVYIFAHSDGPVARALSTTVPVFLGKWSYSIYMVHAAFAGVIWGIGDQIGLKQSGAHLLSTPFVELCVYSAYMVAVVICSAFTYHLLEDPVRKWFDQITRAKRLATA